MAIILTKNLNATRSVGVAVTTSIEPWIVATEACHDLMHVHVSPLPACCPSASLLSLWTCLCHAQPAQHNCCDVVG
eukprot:CAMPEP_0183401460 /NCGR_PEP_ID=MMETSP0370-20130417/13271_1 /TAXON_ID=268820 /ORGANISM="Peridinium aciculiferum, Strain PAER-2" /LENGTH=75 /DNA_ID=CAMNT_0025582917 /DNA_START=5 /DNA_END=228 /DNA_ORIENTATION=+